MKKRWAFFALFILLFLSLAPTVGLAGTAPLKYQMGGKTVTDIPLTIKGDVYFQTTTIEKWFSVKFKLDTKTKKVSFTANKKTLAADYISKQGKNWIPLVKFASLMSYVVVKDPDTNLMYILKKLSGNDAAIALFDAVASGSVQQVREALLGGAKINVIFNKQTPLMNAVISNNLEMVKFMLSKQADLTIVNGYSNNQPLTEAILHRYEEMSIFLLDKGADPNYQPKPTYYNNLLIAINVKVPKVVNALLEKGADPNVVVTTDSGETVTPLELAATEFNEISMENGNQIVKITKPLIEQVQILLDKDADPKKDHSLLKAIGAEDFSICELLLKAGADPNQKDPFDQSAIKVASIKKNRAIGDLLKSYGATDSFVEYR